MKNWYKEWFASDEYLRVYKHRDKSDAEKLFLLIEKNTNINNNSIALDAACGNGRHSKFLSNICKKVISFDLSKTLLGEAVRSFNSNNIDYINCDIRFTPLKINSFDIIVNLFTSFGYFESDEENFKFLLDSHYLLKENGFFVFDYLNKSYVLDNLVPNSEKQIDDKSIVEKRYIQNERVIKEILIRDNEKEQKFYESVRLYSSEEIIKLFKNLNFNIVSSFGDYDGSDFKKNSPRIILICQK